MMRNKSPNGAVDAGVPMSSSAVSQHPPSPYIQPLSQPAENPYSPNPVGYAPALTNLSLAEAGNDHPILEAGQSCSNNLHHTHGYIVHQ